MRGKLTYQSSINKRRVRDELFSYFKRYKKIKGLAGPDINEYIVYLKTKGFRDIHIYEKENIMLLHQLGKLKHKVNFTYADINDHLMNEKGVLYDLDYCCTIKNVHGIETISSPFIMTFSLRMGKDSTLNEFFTRRNEHVVTRTQIDNSTATFVTNKSTYIAKVYKDTSVMMCIAKIK